MKGDFSRLAFRPSDHDVAVLMQQGRVQLDADWNLQQQITDHRSEAQSTDVVGPTGAPKDGGGFAVGVTDDGRDLTLSPGRFYVDGILCDSTAQASDGVVQDDGRIVLSTWELDGRPVEAGHWLEVGGDPVLVHEADAATRVVRVESRSGLSGRVPVRRVPTVGTQPHRYDGLGVGDGRPGRYGVYLRVRKHHVTAVDDPSIAEPALGGVDTTTRLRVVWQAMLVRLGEVGQGDCAALEAALPRPPTGTLEAKVDAEATAANPCLLPPTAGFSGLENQLYRVEVHDGRTFKWSRDNGSVATALRGVGLTAEVESVGRDETLGFDDHDLVEVVDRRAAVHGEPGDLLKLDDVDGPARTVTFERVPVGVDASLRPVLRRWDGTGDIADEWVALEQGISVRFPGGDYRSGDYWTIPARTGVTPGGGDIDWPRDDAGAPSAVAPQGVRDHVAPLALVDFDGRAFRAAPLDCRRRFPSLTSIAASDVAFDDAECGLGAITVQDAIEALCHRHGSACTVVVEPGDHWDAPLRTLPAGADAEICFPVGEFVAAQPVVLSGLGHVVIVGAGGGTRLRAGGGEAALVLRDCLSVTVRDLTVIGGDGGIAEHDKGLNGALTIRDTPDVVIERVSATCRAQAVREATCLTVSGRAGAPASVRVSSCDLTVGQHQVGMVLTDVRRAQVADNVVRAAPLPAGRPPIRLVDNAMLRGMLLRALVSDLRVGSAATATPTLTATAEKATPVAKAGRARKSAKAATAATAATANAATAPSPLVRAPIGRDVVPLGFRLGDLDVEFFTAPKLTKAWAKVLEANPPKAEAVEADIASHVKELGHRILLGEAVAGGQTIRRFVNEALRQAIPVMGQGIVVAGRAVDEVRIVDNTVVGAVRGITVAASHREDTVGAPDVVGRVVVARNTVEVGLPPEATRGRYGVFVGNCRSAVVEGNLLTVVRAALAAKRTVEAVRLFGVLGPMVQVRGNQAAGFSTGVIFHPTNRDAVGSVLWAVVDNHLGRTSPTVAVPDGFAGKVRQSGNVS